MRRLLLLAFVLAGTAACGGTGQEVGTAATGDAGTTGPTAPSGTVDERPTRTAPTDELALGLVGTWEATSPRRFCPVGMAIGATSTEPASDAVAIDRVDKVTFADGTMTLTSDCGEIADASGNITRCTGSYRITEVSGTDAAWHGQLGADTLDCTPSARTFEETMVSVSGDRLRLGEVEFER